MNIKNNVIRSERLDLKLLNLEALQLSLAGDFEVLQDLLGVEIHPEWLYEKEFIELRYQQILNNPDYQTWSIRAIVLRETGKMIGHIGFHTRPGADYLQPYAENGVEFGFTIFPEFRRNGYAREASVAVMDWAHGQHGVSEFVLTIRPDNIPSRKLAQSLGYVKVGSHVDEVDGVEDIFRLDYLPV